MEAYPLRDPGTFGVRGECPHAICKRDSVFLSTCVYPLPQAGLMMPFMAIMQCQGCLNFILARVERNTQHGNFVYIKHWPMGEPSDDEVSGTIPEEVSSEFKEALRCQWIKGYRATVLMCRRALQVSCDKEEAVGNDLFTQIDDLAKKQKITEPLKKMAHRIRLLGKRGAHGDFSDIDATIKPVDAEEAVTFMRHYLEHVYVLPAKLEPAKEPEAKA
jgi:hypothetical protein